MQSVSPLDLYDRDFYLWSVTTAKLLKERRFEEVDLANLIEEIETMGRSEKRELESRLATIIEHLIKCIYWESEKAYNLRGWYNTILEQREQTYRILKDSPSLKNSLPELFLESYQSARKLFLKKLNLPLDIVPVEPPFTIEQVLDFDYLP
jgi:hypothetical protein